MTAVISMNRFEVIFILFSIFSVQSWWPCWCCWSLITTNYDIVHHMCSSWHSLNGIKPFFFLPFYNHYYTMFFKNKVPWGKPEGAWLHLSIFMYNPGCNIIHRDASDHQSYLHCKLVFCQPQVEGVILSVWHHYWNDTYGDRTFLWNIMIHFPSRNTESLKENLYRFIQHRMPFQWCKCDQVPCWVLL